MCLDICHDMLYNKDMKSKQHNQTGGKTMESLLEKINKALGDGGTIIVATYGMATQYTKKHLGWFTVGNDGSLYVRYGKRKNCLSIGDRLLVSIKAYK